MNFSRERFAFSVALAGLCLWGFFLYAQTFHAPFLFDDEEFVIRNPAVRYLGDPSLWQDLNFRKRIVAFFTFALNYRVHGIDVFGYHVVNTAIHVFSGLCVVWFVLLLFATPRMREETVARHRKLIAFLCGWLFVSHPVQTEAVSYISQRFECLAALFYLLAVCFYLKARTASVPWTAKGFLFSASGLAAILGMLTKETVFTFPLSIGLIEWVFFQIRSEESKDVKDNPDPGSRWIYIAGVGLIVILIILFLFPNFFRLFTEHAKIGIPWDLYLMTQFRVILKYFGLLFLPLRQNLDYDFSLSPGPLDGATLLCAFCVLGVLLLGFKLIRKQPLCGFGILWFYLTLSVSSSFMPLKDLIFEHRLYLPFVGFSMALFAGLYAMVKSFRLFVSCSVIFILALSFLAYHRNKVWADEVALWENAVGQSPLKARPHANLGKAYRNRGEYQKAAEYYLKAIALHHGDPRPLSLVYTNLGSVYGKLRKYPEEVAACRKAIELNSKNAQAFSNLGFAYASMGDYGNALLYGGKAVRMAPRFDEAWNNLGVTYGRMRQYGRSAACLERALALNPYSMEARGNLKLTRDLMAGKLPIPSSVSTNEERSSDNRALASASGGTS